MDTVKVLITLDEDVILKNRETCLSWTLGCSESTQWVAPIVALLLARGANPNMPFPFPPPPISLSRVPALMLSVRLSLS